MAGLEYTVKYTVKWTRWYYLFRAFTFCFGRVKSKRFERFITDIIKDKKVGSIYFNGKKLYIFYFKDFLPDE